MENTKVLQIQTVINELETKDFGLYFFVIDTKGNPTGGIANVYQHVKVLNDLGYKASILHEKNDYHGVASWLGKEYMELPHVSIENQELKVKTADFIFVPDFLSTLMDQIKDFPCKKIVFAQNYHFLLELLPIGKKWSDYGFNTVITTSETQSEYIKKHFPSVTPHVIPVSIAESFKPSDELQLPIIGIHTREQSDALRIIKSFYLQFPQYKWVTFKDLRGMPREEFAKDLKSCAASVWVDDISGFGTFPLESIECGVPVIGKIPTMVPEWMVEEEGIKSNGVWTNNTLFIPQLIAEFMNHWLEDNLPEELYTSMNETSGKYSEAIQATKINEIYSQLVENRKSEMTEMIKNIGE